MLSTATINEFLKNNSDADIFVEIYDVFFKLDADSLEFKHLIKNNIKIEGFIDDRNNALFFYVKTEEK